jgi:hypothetical protein
MSNKDFNGEGIKESQIENYNQYKVILESYICPICLDVVKNPWQCDLCEQLYCEECWEFIKMGNKQCVLKCTSNIVKANKFVLDALSKLKITCETCNKTNIDYNLFIYHYEVCGQLQNLLQNNDMEKLINENQMKVYELTACIEKMKVKGSEIFAEELTLGFSPNDIRNKLLSFNLNTTQKVLLYETTISGNINAFKELILKKKNPIFEEVSAQGFLWTPLHYAMHYGQEEIIMFILGYLKSQLNCLDLGIRLASKDGRCPIMCLLKSNSVKTERKKEILYKILNEFKPLKITEEAKLELRARKLESFFLKNNIK